MSIAPSLNGSCDHALLGPWGHPDKEKVTADNEVIRDASARFLNPSEAAKMLGVSAKALRLYEQRGLVAPIRTAAGWRVYGPGEMARAAEIVALRQLGLSLGQVARVLGGNAEDLEQALAAHQSTLEGRVRQLAGDVERVHRMRANLASGQTLAAGTREPDEAGLGDQRRLRSAMALGRRAVRTARHPVAELYHRSAGLRKDAAGQAPGGDTA